MEEETVAGEDTFPFLREALERAGEHHNVAVICSSIMSAWLFTCIVQKMRGFPTPTCPLMAGQRDVMGYEVKFYDRDGWLAIIPRKYAKAQIGRSELNISDVFAEGRKGSTKRMSLQDWQEKEGLIRPRPLNRFDRMDVEAGIEGRGKRLDEFPKKSWIQVERKNRVKPVIVQVVSWTYRFEYKLVRDAKGREFRIYHHEVLSAVRVPRPKKVV